MAIHFLTLQIPLVHNLHFYIFDRWQRVVSFVLYGYDYPAWHGNLQTLCKEKQTGKPI